MDSIRKVQCLEPSQIIWFIEHLEDFDAEDSSQPHEEVPMSIDELGLA